jgi:pantetheine-phosphate adenylyltransferase
MIAIYPGTFDPITFGHMDIIERASRIFKKVILAIAENDPKKPLFSLEERKELVRASIPKVTNVEIQSFRNLLVHFAREQKASAIIRGLRAVSDFEYEFQMALMNKKLAPDVETFFMMPDEAFTYLSSKNIKEIAQLGGDVSPFVPKIVKEALSKRFLETTVH